MKYGCFVHLQMASKSPLALKLVTSCFYGTASLVGLLTSIAFSGNNAVASEFDAICGTIRCQLTLSREKILTPYGVMPTSRVSSWGGGGRSESDLILGSSMTYLLGPVGLIGFAAKTHDYNYALNGYDSNGKKMVVRIQFKNKLPAQKFAKEMAEFTRLSMNDSRTAAEIKGLERLMKFHEVKWLGDLPPSHLDQGSRKFGGGHDELNKSKNSDRCWEQKLDSNPLLREWADSNPELAEQQKSKSSSCVH